MVELVDLVNYVIIFLCQTTLFGWLTFILGSQTVILTTLLFWIYFFLLMPEFVLQWLSLHLGIQVMLLSQFPVFPSNSQWDALFHRIAYDQSHADWGSICDNLRDIPQENIFKLTAFTAGSEFFEWVQVGIDVYIRHRKYQVKPHSSPWFSVSCAAVIVHRNHIFRLYQQNKSSESICELPIVYSRINLLNLFANCQQCTQQR